MSKRGEFKRNNVWSKKHNRFDEHDDRSDRSSNNFTVHKKTNGNRRVSFKPANQQQGGKQPIKLRTARLGLQAAQFDDDDDDRMVEFTNSKGGTFRRRNSPIPGSARNNKAKGLIENASGWYQVTIPHGNKYEKDFTLKALLSAITPEIFIPHYWRMEPNAAIFYVDDFKIAKILANADRTIEMPNGFKMIIKVRNSIPPVQLDAGVREQMKLAMAKRYNAQNNALDLASFHTDPDLSNVYCGLSRAPIMAAVIDIISENIPNLGALSLEKNKIYTLEHSKSMVTKLPNLKILHLANNKIAATSALETLKSSNIVDLVLTGNPICERIRDESVYIREVRKRVPKLLRLDGKELPPQIGFDVDTGENSKLPPAKQVFFINASGVDVVRQFLEQYYLIFDSDNRQPLLEAYHENATFSLTCTYHTNPEHRLTNYLQFNRNLQRLKDPEKKAALLKCGRLPVVSFLTELPKTQHDVNSFAVDLTICTEMFMMLSVTGVFREKQTPQGRDKLRSFHRTLIIVKCGSGYCIKNDMLHINNLTMAQVKTAFKPIDSVPVTVGSVQAPVVPTPVQPTIDEATKLQMVQAMAQHSQMNLEWSRRCLEETNWDFNRAGAVFTELNKTNKIPAEAFLK